VIIFQRKGGQPYRHEFTLEDAKRAGLADADNYRKYPKAMLFSRCMSAGARAMFPDVLAGMYTPEELGEPVVVDVQTGEIIIAPQVDEAKAATAVVEPNAWTRTVGALDKIAQHYGLSYDSVLAALNVKQLVDFGGTKGEAKRIIDAFIAEQAGTVQAEEETAELAAEPA